MQLEQTRKDPHVSPLIWEYLLIVLIKTIMFLHVSNEYLYISNKISMSQNKFFMSLNETPCLIKSS